MCFPFCMGWVVQSGIVAQVFLSGTFSNKEEVTALLRAAGAKLLTRPPARQLPSASSGDAACKSVVLWDKDRPQKGSAGGVSAVQQLPLTWFLDSVSRFVVQPVTSYQM